MALFTNVHTTDEDVSTTDVTEAHRKNLETRGHRGLRATAAAVIMAITTMMVVLAPAAMAVPLVGTGGAAAGTSPAEPVIRTITRSVPVGVPYVAALAIGVLAFGSAWLLATYAAGHRAHRQAVTV
jgi:hypothetical protein